MRLENRHFLQVPDERAGTSPRSAGQAGQLGQIDCVDLHLEHNTLVIMWPPCQEEWRHEVCWRRLLCLRCVLRGHPAGKDCLHERGHWQTCFQACRHAQVVGEPSYLLGCLHIVLGMCYTGPGSASQVLSRLHSQW